MACVYHRPSVLPRCISLDIHIASSSIIRPGSEERRVPYTWTGRSNDVLNNLSRAASTFARRTPNFKYARTFPNFLTSLLQQHHHHHGGFHEIYWRNRQARHTCHQKMIRGHIRWETMASCVLQTSHTGSNAEGAETYGRFAEVSRGYLQW